LFGTTLLSGLVFGSGRVADRVGLDEPILGAGRLHEPTIDFLVVLEYRTRRTPVPAQSLREQLDQYTQIVVGNARTIILDESGLGLSQLDIFHKTSVLIVVAGHTNPDVLREYTWLYVKINRKKFTQSGI
jgi:hypothetical protein